MFGPMLTIIGKMFKEVAKFLFIWVIILVVLSSVSSLLFGDIETYAGFFNVFFVMFGTGLGNYELEDFSQSQYPENFGKFFIVFAVIVNSIVLLNFIIAILADTYSKLSQQSLGLYYDGIISRIPIYEDDSRYGGLIIGSPPFNIFAIFLIPIFCCYRKDKKRLQAINEKFTKMIYAPIALFVVLIFAALTLMMVPFAYLAALYHKIRIMTCHMPKKNSSNARSKTKKRTSGQMTKNLLIFLLLGIPMLLLSWVKDTYYFLV